MYISSSNASVVIKPQKRQSERTTHHCTTMASVPTQHASWALQRAANAQQVKNDVTKVREYVKSNLFEKVVFVWQKTALARGGKLHQDYLKNCRALVAEGKLVDMADSEAVTYMNLLWDTMTKDRCYVDWTKTKRSNTYQAMQDKFMSE